MGGGGEVGEVGKGEGEGEEGEGEGEGVSGFLCMKSDFSITSASW